MVDYPFFFTWVKQSNPLRFTIASVDGVKIYTETGHELIDMSSISYQASFGHNHPTIIKHMKDQLDTVPMSAPRGIFAGKIEATNELLKYMDKKDGKVFYATGGAEAVENALKMARDITKKKLILARQISYHGATMGALSVTGDWRNQKHAIPGDWVVRIPEPSEPDAIAKTRQLILDHGQDKFAAFIIETITGGNGVYEGSQEWWDGISNLCKEFGILLIMDEVICGFGRTGVSFGYMHYNVRPDIITLAKGITGGMVPFGAVWVCHNIADFYMSNVLACGLTNYGHPLGIAAMSGVLEIVQDFNFQKHLQNICKVFKRELSKLSELPEVDSVRVKGMLAAVDLNVDIQWKTFFDKGIHLATQNKRIVLAPPLIISESELVEGMARFKRALKEFDQ
jgi:taurine--2-oxoglutarate transaminase